MSKFHIAREGRFFVLQMTIMLAFLTAISPFATDTYMPALPTMSQYFGKPINLLEITLTIYFLGVAVGQFLGGPLSDSYGRKKVAMLGLFLFATSSILAVFVTDVYYLWVLRFLQAIGGGFASVVNMAFVRDWFEGKDVARISSLISMIMMLAPLVAPVIGTFLLIHYGWQSIFIFMFLFSLLVLIAFSLFMPESRHHSFITNKLTFRQVKVSYSTIFSSPKAVFLVLCSSFSIAGMFTFLTGASFMYIDFFGVDVSNFPLYFGANVVLNVILTMLNYRLVKRIEPEKLLQAGLLLQFVSGIALLIAVLQPNPSLWFVFISIILFVGSLGLVFSNLIAIILNQFHQISGSANAVIGVVRFAFSGLIGSSLALFHTGDLVPLGGIMFACTLVANLMFIVSKKVRW